MGYEYQVDIGGVLYGMKDIESGSIESPLFDKLSVGNTCCAELNISFWPTETPPRMVTIIPYIRAVGATAWDQLGIFYTDTRLESDGKMSMVAYDAMLKADAVWEPDQALKFPMSMPDAVTEIASLMGVEIDPRTSLNAAYTIDYPANDYTLRDVLGYIAAAHAGNWIITTEGKLLLVPLFSSMPAETHYLVTENGDAITFGGVRILVGDSSATTQSAWPWAKKFFVGKRVSDFEAYSEVGPITGIALVVDRNNEYQAGDQAGYVMEIECPYGTQAMADDILSKIAGNTYKGYRAENAILDPMAELGDGVTVNGVYSMLAYRKVNFGPGHMSEIAAPGENDIDHEYPYVSPAQREINRKLAQTRATITKTAEEIRLEVANEVQGLSASFDVQLGSISAEIVGVENAISSLELDMESILSRIQDAEGNMAQLELTAQEIRSEVSGKIDEESAQTLIDQAIDSIALSVTSSAGSTTFKLTGGGVDISTATLNLSVAAANISGQLTASQIDVGDLKFDTLWASETKVAAYASGDTIHIGGRSGSETFENVYLHGSTITLNRWSDSNSGIVIQNGTSNYKVYPISSSLYSLGDATHPWAGCYTNGISIIPNSSSLYGMTLNYAGIVPAKTEYMDLGSSTYKWNNLYVKNIVLDGTTLYPDRISYSSTIYASMNSAKAFVPYASTGYSIGSSSYPWATGYFTALYIDGKAVSATPEVSKLTNGSYTVSLNASAALVPGSSGYALGSSSYYWATAYITKLYLSSSCYITAGSSSTIKVGTTTIGSSVAKLVNGSYTVSLGSGALTPASSGSYNLGSSSYYWNYLYVAAIRLYYSSYSYITLTANSSGKLCVGGTAIH